MFGPGSFRLVLALVVVLSHTSSGRFGVVAVMVFFVLSGFWVCRMYDERYSRFAAPIRSFYLSRFLRLWPPFAVAVLLALALTALRGERVWLTQAQVLPMLGVASGLRDPLGISWSLDIEMQFYIVLPLLLSAAARSSKPADVTGLLLLTSAGWIVALGAQVANLFQYLPAFAAGIWLWRGDIRVSGRTAALSLGLFLLAAVLLLAFPATRGLVIEAPVDRRLIRPGALLWALTLIPFVAWNVRQRGLAIDRMLGDLSYSLYLVHFPLLLTLDKLWHPGRDPATVAVKLAACLAAALLFYWLIDRPSEGFRQRVGSRQVPRQIIRTA